MTPIHLARCGTSSMVLSRIHQGFAAIAELEESPDLIYAKVHHVELRYWGPYPVLVYGKTGAVVEEVAWFVPSVEVINRPRAYETNAYYDGFVEMEFKDGEKVRGRAFKWARDEEYLADSPESYVEDLSDSD
jgi:hypothetical protein